MQLGVEMLATAATPLHLGSFFETWLSAAEGSVRRSLGRDEYHLELVIDAGRRLAATGRTSINQVDAQQEGIGANQMRSAVLVPTRLAPGEPVSLGIRTNVFLTTAALRAGVQFRVLRAEAASVWDGTDTTVVIAEVMPGRFLIDLTPLMPQS